MRKKLVTLLIAAAFGITSIGGLATASASGFGAAGASTQSSYTLPEMLTYAIQDEYLAQAEYQKIIDSLAAERPFTNIIKAEQQHINELLPLFAAHQLEVPLNDAASRTIAPASLLEAYKAGVEAEEKNIAMYDSFLQQQLPADVRTVFEELRDASQKHLQAFQRNLDRPGSDANRSNQGWRAGDGTGFGPGNPNGSGPNKGAGLGQGQDQCTEPGQMFKFGQGHGRGAGMNAGGSN